MDIKYLMRPIKINLNKKVALNVVKVHIQRNYVSYEREDSSKTN